MWINSYFKAKMQESFNIYQKKSIVIQVYLEKRMFWEKDLPYWWKKSSLILSFF